MEYVVVGLALAAAALWSARQIILLARRVPARRERRTLRDNARMGREGELAAERLLRRRGYRIITSQTSRTGTFWVDGAPQEFTVRVDFLVSRWWRTYAVEVKTGSSAPSPKNRATRRQLFEYSHLYDVDGLILADMTAGELRDIRFASPRSHLGWHSLAAMLCLGALLGLLLPPLLRGELPW